MFSLKSMESIISLMTIVLAYFFVATIAGFFRAWVARAMGDDTPERMGFLNFNPLVHIDPMGFFLMIFLGFGWVKHVIINPYNITINKTANHHIFCYLHLYNLHYHLSILSIRQDN